MTESPIWILLATYDGERFLRRQLASLFAQTDRNWRLLVRDDGSSDRTPALLGAAAAADARVRVMDDDGGRLGSSGNFFRLMHAALAEGADYFAFCDQDDIWQPDKLATLRAALRAGERAAAPCLVYSDLSWIDARGDEIARSHFRASCGGMPEQDHCWLMAMNLIPGCAMLGNRALLECALRRTDLAHHDWWVALVAAAMGELVRVERPLLAYRLHGGNAIGARSLLARCIGFVLRPLDQLARGYEVHWVAVGNAHALLAAAGACPLNPGWRAGLEAVVAELGSPRRARRVRAVLAGPARRVGSARRLLAVVAALKHPPSDAGVQRPPMR